MIDLKDIRVFFGGTEHVFIFFGEGKAAIKDSLVGGIIESDLNHGIKIKTGA